MLVLIIYLARRCRLAGIVRDKVAKSQCGEAGSYRLAFGSLKVTFAMPFLLGDQHQSVTRIAIFHCYHHLPLVVESPNARAGRRHEADFRDRLTL
jgi:hypothetical protein